MSEPADMPGPSRRDAMLSRLAELALSATELAHEWLAAAGDDAAFPDAGRTLGPMARRLRQTFALRDRFAHNAERRTREARSTEAAREVDRRKAQVRNSLERRIYTERERAEADAQRTVWLEVMKEAEDPRVAEALEAARAAKAKWQGSG
jgi:hypothetical protein